MSPCATEFRGDDKLDLYTGGIKCLMVVIVRQLEYSSARPHIKNSILFAHTAAPVLLTGLDMFWLWLTFTTLSLDFFFPLLFWFEGSPAGTVT